MEDSSFEDMPPFQRFHEEPLIEALSDINHPCNRCHEAHDQMSVVFILKSLMEHEKKAAGDVMDDIPRLLRQMSEKGIDMSLEEIKRIVGEGLAESLELSEEDLINARARLEELVENCDGIVSMSTERADRIFGVIACGSTMLPDCNYDTETVHITRIS